MNLPYSINVNGRLLTMERPLVMGIVNVTSDSFYEASRTTESALVDKCRAMLADGADIIDIGACSTRPSSQPVSASEELASLHSALEIINKEFPCAALSVDTFRADVARECVKEHSVAIINDVSAGEWDAAMFDVVAELNVPYVLTHTVGKAGEEPVYKDFLPDVYGKLSSKLWNLRQRGVKDVIVDPGFGFGKSLQQNYQLMATLDEFSMFETPLLVGISRKSMVTKVLGVTADEALGGTIALNTVALMKGANILRVHDVKAAVEAVKIVEELKNNMK